MYYICFANFRGAHAPHAPSKSASELMMRSTLYKTNTFSWIFIVLAHWNKNVVFRKSLSYQYVNIRETKWNYFLHLFRTRVMVLNPNFNNISAISWRSVLLVEETGVHGKNHRPAASHLQPLSHYVELSTPRHQLFSHAN